MRKSLSKSILLRPALGLGAVWLTTALFGNAPASALTPQQQQRGQAVTRLLREFLSKRITTPGGKANIVIRPGARPDLGQFSEITISGRPIQLKKKARISEFAMRARNVRIDPNAILRVNDRKLTTLASSTTLRAVVTEDDITAMFAKGKHSRDMNIRVKFVGDKIQVSGNWNWGWFSGPVTMLGKLRLAKTAAGNEVFFDIMSLTLNGAEVPGFLKNKFSERLNPLISVDDLPFLPKLKSLTFSGNKAILRA